MRISDWSSDVCSSDLRRWRRARGRILREDNGQRINQRAWQRSGERIIDGLRVAPGRHHLVAPKPRQMLGQCRLAEPDDLFELAHRDRKRVVEGTSVSVRVDLGGRRSIKKKKNK